MKMTNQRLCNAFIFNTSTKSKFFAFEIITVRECESKNGGTEFREIKTASEFLDEYDALDEPFYRVRGLYRKERTAPNNPTEFAVIAEFPRVEQAKSFLEDLTGETIWVHYY